MPGSSALPVRLAPADSRSRRRAAARQWLVLGAWLLASALLAAALLAVLPHGPRAPWIEGLGGLLVAASTCAVVAITALAPIAAWAGRALAGRDADERLRQLGAPEDPSLAGLSPGLEALVADARLVRSVIESEAEHELALRCAWEWVQRRESLSEGERALLADRAGDASDIDATIAWARAQVEHARIAEGLARLGQRLAAVERALLDPGGPYRS